MGRYEGAGEFTALGNSRVHNPPGPSSIEARHAIMQALCGRSKKALFATEIFALARRRNIAPEAAERALADLESEGKVIVRDHFCADPHLSGVDLRVAALVDDAPAGDSQANALHEIDTAWDKWLASYLANHRCG
jgi:hypothetical protein